MNKAAMKKHWKDFKNSPDYGMMPYIPLLLSPGLVGIEFEDK